MLILKVSTTPSGGSNNYDGSHNNNRQRPRARMISISAVAIFEMMLILSCCVHVKPTGAAAAAAALLASSADAAAAAAAPSYLDVNSFDLKKGKSPPAPAAVSTKAEVDAEILQLPHAFRHQEHYSHRIEQAVNDFRRAQLEQRRLLEPEPRNVTKPFIEAANSRNNNNKDNVGNDSNNNNRQNDRHEQHHRRHEQHLKPRQQPHAHPHYHHHHHHHQREQHQTHSQQPEVALPHHLRHHNRHHETWQERVFPAQRHQRHEHRGDDGAATGLSASSDGDGDGDGDADYDGANTNNQLDASAHGTLNVTHALQMRYFDRESLYNNARLSAAAAAAHASTMWTHTTRGPRTPRHHNDNALRNDEPRSGSAHIDRAFGDEPLKEETEEESYDDSESADDDEHNENDGDNKSDANQLSGKRYSLKLAAAETRLEGDDVGLDQTPGHAKGVDVAEAAADDDDDDDDDYLYEDADTTQEERTRKHDALLTGSVNAKTAVKRYTNPFKSPKTSLPRHFETAYDDGTDYRSDDRDVTDYEDKPRSSDDEDESESEESADSDIETVYSRDKWNRIEHQHHLKQQQHQRDLQLRLQHAPGGSHSQGYHNKYAAVQDHNKNEEDTPNIFSRNYIPGTLTRQKQDELGTLEAVQQSRRNHVMKQMQNKALANAHAKQIFSEAVCRLPQRRVERIQRDPTKIYTPHCTVLHRCADDTGCCKSDRQTCAPKRTKSVDLYFFVKSINDKRGSIERLTFVNHTECHCVEKAKQQPPEYGSTALYGVGGGNVQLLRRATILNCNCPRLYEKILQEDGFCRCDCSSGNTGCDWLKRGMEHFSMIDRKCISEGRCKPPTCAYGSYMKKHGRCSRREEQLSAALTLGAGGGAAPLTTNSIKTRGYH